MSTLARFVRCYAPIAGALALAAAGVATAATFPSNNVAFQTSGPGRPPTIGDWYTTATSASTDRMHRFLVEITQAQLDAGSGSITITVNDAESAAGPGPCDEVDNNPCTAPVGTGVGDPTRFTLRMLSSSSITGGSQVGAAQIFPSGSANGSTATFIVTRPGIYEVTSEDGGIPIFGDATANLNDDDNAFTITVPFAGGANGGGIGSFQGSFQQDTGASINVSLYFLVGPGTTSLALRNFDLDNGGVVSYTKPNGTQVAGTASGNGVWNGAGGTLNAGQDTVAANNTSSAGAGDAGMWTYTISGFTNHNQTIFEADDQNGNRIPALDVAPQRAGNFSMAPADVLQTQIGVPVDHPFTVTNLFYTNDIINFTITNTSPNYTVQLLTSGGTPLTDTDGDGKLDTGILTPQQSANFILRVTPQPGASVSDTSIVNGVSFMDTKVDPLHNTTVFIDKTTLLPPQLTKSFSPNPLAPNGVSVLTFTLSNVNTVPLTAAQFSDTLPASPAPGLKVATTPGASTSNCGAATWAPAANATTLSFSGGTLAAASSCTIKVNVTGSTVGTYANTTGAVTATAPVTAGSSSMTGGAANASLVIQNVAPPSVAKAFGTSPIALNAATTLTLTVSNPNAGTALAGVAVSDTYPAGLINATTPNAATTCPGAALAGGGAGGNSIGISGASLAAGASCTVTVSVTSAAAGSYNNVTGAVSSTNGGTGNTANASLVVDALPTLAKSFTPAAINVNGVSLMTLTLSNSNSTPLEGAAFTDSYPAGLVNTATPNAATTCGAATVSAAAGGGSLGLSGGTIPANGSCTVTVNVTRASAGSSVNTIAAGGLTVNGGLSNALPASATLAATAVLAPVVSKAFTPTTIQNGASSTLTLTVSNPNSTAALSGVAVSDAYPANLVNAATPGVAVTCSAGSTANSTGGVAGGGSIGLVGGDLQPGGNCQVIVSVTSTVNGTYTNTTGAVTATSPGALTGNTASSTLTVQAAGVPLQLAKSFAPASIGSGGVSLLTLAVSNPNNAAISGITFTDTFPTSPGTMTLANTTTSNSCGGALTNNSGGALAAGAPGIRLSGGTLAANASCSITVNVTATTTGSYTNTTGTIAATGLAAGAPASAGLSVSRPTIAKSFSPTLITAGSTTQLSLVLSNPSGVDFTAASFTDTFPTSPGTMTVASTTVSNSCGGSITASGGGALAVGSAGIALSGGTIPAGGSCDIVLSVTASAGGTYTNTVAAGALTSSGGSNAGAASAQLTVPVVPAVSKSFTPSNVQTNALSTLTITLSNSNAVAATGAGFTDTLPAGLTTSGAATTSCANGVASQTTNSVSLSGGTIPAAGSCSVTISVFSAAAGSYTNTIAAGGLTASTGSSTTPGSATLVVTAPPSMSKSFTPASVGAGQTTVLSFSIVNPAGNTTPLTGVAFGDALPSLPAQMVVAPVPAASTSGCGSPIFGPLPGATSLSFSGGSIAVNGTCTVSVTVVAPLQGVYNNASSAVTATGPIALIGNIASASLSAGAPALMVMKTVAVLTDPVNGSVSPKSIPGAEELYNIVVTNTGAGQVDADTTVVTDPVPSNCVLFVGASSGSSGLTVTFIDGAGGNSSGLNPLTAADISYSSSPGGGAPFTYAPAANSYDSNVTGIRIALKGALKGASVTGNPSFQLRFKVKVQ